MRSKKKVVLVRKKKLSKIAKESFLIRQTIINYLKKQRFYVSSFPKKKIVLKKKYFARIFIYLFMELVNDEDGSRIVLFKKWLTELECNTLFEYCTRLETKLYPFKLKQNRLLWACGDLGVYHEFRGVNVDINEWSSECLSLKDRLLSEFDVYNNFCLINHYRNGYDSIAPHSDGELYSKNKSVFTVAVGITRTMKLVPYSSLKQTIVFDFNPGDLLWMCGNVQSKWKHGIDVDANIIHPRYSFTFRSTLLKSLKKRKCLEEKRN